MADGVQLTFRFPLTVSAIDRDWAENVYYIKPNGATTEDVATDWSDAIQNAYNLVQLPGPVPALCEFMGGIDRTNCEVQVRELTLVGGTLSPLLATFDWTLAPAPTGAAGHNLPSEVALCVSWESDDQGPTTTSRRRRRGRTYIGPLVANANGTETLANPSRPAGDFQQSAVGFGSFLAQRNPTLGGSGIGDLCVYSRAGEALSVINKGYVDNEWDSQRRRGVEANTRSLFSA